jgi:hypothetical protein
MPPPKHQIGRTAMTDAVYVYMEEKSLTFARLAANGYMSIAYEAAIGYRGTHCIEDRKSAKSNGYPMVYTKDGTIQTARAVYLEIRGHPAGEYSYDLHHICGNPLCVNLHHLMWAERTEHRQYHKRTSITIPDAIIDMVRNEMQETGAGNAELAERYGISPATVSKIRNGYRRKYRNPKSGHNTQ